MKKVLIGGGVMAVLALVVNLSQSRLPAVEKAGVGADGIQAQAEAKNPWTSLQLNSDAGQFQFAVVSDRTGGHREKIFSKAVHQINLLQPEFVMSVGDLIEGYTTSEEKLKEYWSQFDGYVSKFEMPFFYVPGNHDISNAAQLKYWGQRYGKRYYHFSYKGVLFVCLSSENPPKNSGAIDPEQRAWLKNVLAKNANPRWTFVFVHRPIWRAKSLAKNGWGEVEKLLAGRKYTVFCGHLHRYQKYVRNGSNYYQLATTGGGSRIRGVSYREFDQIAWVTMKKETPLVANVLLGGILSDDLNLPATDEPGRERKMLPTHPASGRVTVGGKPTAEATVALHRYNEESKKYTSVCDGKTDENGRFQLTTYAHFDGAPVGEYVITIRQAGESSVIPEVFASPSTTTLRVPIREGENVMKLDLPSR